MTNRENKNALIDVIQYDYFWPDSADEDTVYKFTHSNEVNAVCADIFSPHVITPIDKDDLRLALTEYIERCNISPEDVSSLRNWLNGMPEHIAIIERQI